MESLIAKHWHHLPTDEALDLLDSDKDKGLDVSEAERRRKQFGPNVITAKKGQSAIARLLLQFHQPLIYIMIAAGVITASLQEWVDAGVIFGVVLVNATIGFIQESKAVKAMEALARTMTTEATVLRAGDKRRISAVGLVPGDVVLLQSGDKVPADMRLIQTRNVQIDESALTGESVPVEKKPEPLGRDTPLADRKNIAYASTLVTYGLGRGVVVAIGDNTEVGRISQLIASTEEMQTPLTRKIADFSNVLLYVILGLAGITFAVGLIRGESAFNMFMASVALSVGAIPEGLPAAMTITLAIGVARMAKRRAIIRKLTAVETLGSTTVICSDKTGTLTENEMTVREIMAGGERFEVSGQGYAPSGRIIKQGGPDVPARSTALTECLKAGLLCNDSLLLEKDGRWGIHGDPTEGALIVSAIKGGLSYDAVRAELPHVDTIPFESQHRYMASLYEGGPDNTKVAYLKGSVEAILDRCVWTLDAAGRLIELDRVTIHNNMEEMAGQGLRVLAFAKGHLNNGTNALNHVDVASDLVFLGMQGMIDPPRAESVVAIRNCRTAGIHVKMITGDHALTASAIAKQIGLENPSNVVTGKDLTGLSDPELIETAGKTSVFARVSPEQKLRLVEAIQSRGNIVAMTGDGVNDAPALKRADIGVAMGVTGTDVAKEAASMVLTDDNFASIEAAVEEGRGVFDNLTKFIIWTLPTNIGEGLVVLAAIFAGVTLPIEPVQILWINMTTAVLLGLMLAFEPKEPGIMTRPPRSPKAPILTRELIWRIFSVSALMLIGSFGLFRWELMRGASIAEARTVAVNVFVMVEIFYLFNCRSLTKSVLDIGLFSNPWVWAGVGGMLVLQALYTYLPAMNLMFHSAPISLEAWARILAVATIAFLVVGVEKWLRQRIVKRR
ncbi:MAG: cation-transporting P-type ATPase [Deltaproteobacteria bacterium]|nr:cation-transporting P-type ATPase [Deltaproteobacteria bacterium]